MSGRPTSTPAPAAAPPAAATPSHAPGAVHLALLAVSFCFATFPVAGKWAMAGFEPRVVSTWRVLVGAGVLLGLAWKKHRAAFFLDRRDLVTAAWLSVLGVSANQVLYIEGLKRSSATSAGLFMTVIPVLTYVMALALGRERPLPKKVAGVALAAAGVAVLFFARGARLAADRVLGDVLVVLNAASYSVYLVLAKPLLVRRPALVAIAWIFFFGALVVPFTAVGLDWAPAAGGQAWGALAWVLVFPTVLAYSLNTWALERTEASIVGIYVCLQPLINMGLAALFLGERLTWPAAAAGGLVLSGVWCVTSARPRPPSPGARS